MSDCPPIPTGWQIARNRNFGDGVQRKFWDVDHWGWSGDSRNPAVHTNSTGYSGSLLYIEPILPCACSDAEVVERVNRLLAAGLAVPRSNCCGYLDAHHLRIQLVPQPVKFTVTLTQEQVCTLRGMGITLSPAQE